MFTLLVTGLTCLMASMVSGEAEAEADPHFFYNPYPSYPTSYYPSYPSYPYYYPTLGSRYTYPTRFVKTSAAAATPEAAKEDIAEAVPEAPAAIPTTNSLPTGPLIRRIVPFFALKGSVSYR